MTRCRRWNSATTRWRSTCGQPQTAGRSAPGRTQTCFEGCTTLSELALRHLSQLRCRLTERSWQASRRCCQPAVHDTARSHTLACTLMCCRIVCKD